MSSFPLPSSMLLHPPSPPSSMVMATNTSKKQNNQSPQELGESEPQRRDASEESEEESSSGEEEGQDDFFESFDRVPSRVSFCLDLPSDNSDAEDDVRMSFSSAVGDLRCVTFSREEFLAQHRDDDDTPIKPSKEKQRGGGFQDYGIWMDEPMSVNDRRRRLLQGMGFASKRDYAASLRIRSIRSIRRPPMDAPPPAHTAGSLPPLPPSTAADVPSEAAAPEPQPVDSSPTPAAEQPPVLARCRSDTDLAALRPDSCSVLLRSASFPSSAWDVRVKERSSNGIEDADEGDRGELVVADEQACLTKNQNTEELAVCEVEKDGPEEAQTGLQVTPLGEFERILGSSPIVKELMRRVKIGGGGGAGGERGSNAKIPKSGGKKKGGWLKNIKFVASSVGLISEKADAGTKTGAKASGESSSELMKVRQVGKSSKELTGLCMSQEIQAHQGSIWCIKFSWDGRLLASAGEDRIVQVWQVQESDTARTKPDGALLGSTKKTKKTKSGKRILPDYIVLPETIFSLSEKPVCSFEGHQDDVLDLSWSKSQHLLSSSMDKTVRLWDMETMTCLKLFAHNDYVTCIQFNPVDDNYFISGSLDAKVRIWNIPVRQVVDWTDLHEMVTAACYTPDGQGALVGSHKGTCRLYKTSDCKLTQENQIDIKNKKKKAQAKKITGLQYAPDNSSEVMITSADSLIRVFDELKMVHKFRGLRNTSSQISASFSSDGKYVICASEDSNVYVWKRDATRPAAKGAKTWITTRSHESFFCKDVSVAIPWPCAGSTCPPLSLPATSGRLAQQEPSGATESVHSTSTLDVDPFPSGRNMCPPPLHKKSSSEQCLPTVDEQRSVVDSPSGSGSDSFASPSATTSAGDSVGQSSSMPARGWNTGSENKASSADQSNAWGLVVVTAGMGGDIKVYQNFGLPVRLSRQTNIF